MCVCPFPPHLTPPHPTPCHVVRQTSCGAVDEKATSNRLCPEFRVLVSYGWPALEHLQTRLGWASPSGCFRRDCPSSGSRQESKVWWNVEEVGKDIGFVTPHLSTNRDFVSVCAEMVLWGFSSGSVRVCKSYGLPGAAGNGAGAGGLWAYNSICLLPLLWTEYLGGSSSHFLHLCRKKIPNIEDLNSLHHYKAIRSYPCPPCFRWFGKTNKPEKTPAISAWRLPCWKQWQLQAAHPSAVLMKYIYIKLLCEGKEEYERKLWGQKEWTKWKRQDLHVGQGLESIRKWEVSQRKAAGLLKKRNNLKNQKTVFIFSWIRVRYLSTSRNVDFNVSTLVSLSIKCK